MFLSFEPHRRRLYVTVVVAERVGKTVRQHRVGSLGGVLFSEPISTAERIRFWTAIDRRIPQPRGEEEFRLQLIATIRRDAMAAFDRLERGEDAAEEAMKQLERLTREARQHRSEQDRSVDARTPP
jgi:hypothetical protein